MKISKRELILCVVALTAILSGFTYWLAGSKIAEQRRIKEDKVRLLRQIELHKRILNEKGSWYSRLEELQAQLPVYDDRTAVSAELPKLIKRMADEHGLDLVRTQTEQEKQSGSLYELAVSCNWEGSLSALVHFLYSLHSQGLRYDVLQLTAQPDAQRERILKGSMLIECAYRKGKSE
ncbi:MAG TPA: GspMb/PilO family protein [Pontiellaceae bacterium]|nr:GspMb/PilO family protein [Pontiellaceae bacterium]